MDISLSPLWSIYLIILVLGLFTLITAFLLMRWHRREASPRFRTILIMRIILIFLIVVLFLSPLLSFYVEKEKKRTIAVLMDISKSMFVGTPKTRYDLAFDFVGGLASDEKLDDYELHLYTFDEKLRRVRSIENLPIFSREDINEETSLIRAIEDVISIEGNALSAILIISDGVDTSDMSVLDLPDGIVDVFAYIPDALPKKDISILSMNLDQPLVDSVVTTASISVQAIGLQYGECELRLLQDGKVLAGKTFSPDGVIWRDNLKMSFIPSSGVSIIRAEVSTTDDGVEENNSLSKVMEVREEGLKVLFMSSSPSPEYSTYKNIFLGDNLISLSTICYAPVGEIIGEETNIPIPDDLPTLDKYDVITLLNPTDYLLTEGIRNNLSTYLKRGGGLLTIFTGEVGVPDDVASLVPATIGGEVTEGFNIEQSGYSPVNPGGELPPGQRRGLLYGPSEVGVKLWGQVMFTDDEGTPRIVGGRYGSGRAGVVVFGGLHRERSAGGMGAYFTLISNLARFVGFPHSSGAYQINSHSKASGDGEGLMKIEVIPKYETDEVPMVKVFRVEGDTELIVSQGYGEEIKGLFNYQFDIDGEGTYIVDVSSSEGVVRDYFQYPQPSPEMRELTPDYDTMRYISGGDIIDKESIGDMVKKLESEEEVVVSEKVYISLLRNPLLYILIIVILGVEWYLRRIWGLK